jgi:hypothetical protein
MPAKVGVVVCISNQWLAYLPLATYHLPHSQVKEIAKQINAAKLA